MDKMAIYGKLPVFAQNIACSVEGFRIQKERFGLNFQKCLEEYLRRGSWSPERLAAFRDERLRHMVHYCYDHVPYYHRTFNEGGINPQDIKTLEDMSVLPVLTKADVNAQPDQFVSSEYSGKKIHYHTSGTTGSGFVFLTSPEAIWEQWSCWWRFREALGIELGTPQATFGTQRIVPASQTKPPFWRLNKPGKQMYFSAFHMRDAYLQSYYEAICDSEVEWIHGYPSLLSVLASYMVKKGLSFSQVRWVTTGAENLYKHQADLIFRAFGAMPYEHYGMSEGIANFSQDRSRRMFVDEDYAAVEFLEKDDGTAEVVGSTLTNELMPLLRWKIGDRVKVKVDRDGRREIKSLEGRSEDYLILPNGTKVGKLDHVFKDTIHIAEAQIYQHADYSVTIIAVKTEDDTSEDERLAMTQLEESLNQKIPIEFKYVDEVPRSKSGKLRFVISEVNHTKNDR